MADVFTRTKRSAVMPRIRRRGNQDTELALAKLLRANRISGWRRHVPILGRAALPRGRNVAAARQHRPTVRVRPDFVFRQARTVIFVDGCFWHDYPRHATKPQINRAFWQRILSGRKARYELVNRALRRVGWGGMRIWECELTKQPRA